MQEKHALLSASAASRWINCPPSARLCEKIPEDPSTYAQEGTLAHSMCEIKLNAFVTPTPKRTVTSRLNKLKKNELYASEMDGHTDTYVDYVKKIALSFPTKATVTVETKVDYSNYAPEGFGTADCLIIHGADLYVIDFKYGQGVPVSAEENPQMKLYALGALNLYGMFYPIKNIHFTIVQPRLNNISEWDTTIEALKAWGESIKPIAQLAYDGKGEYSSGEHCRFCKIKATCRKRAENNLELAKHQFAKPIQLAKKDEPKLTDSEVGSILQTAKDLKKWVEDLEKYALKSILEGKPIDGWKAVEGRGSRNWNADTDVITQRLSSLGYPQELAFERKVLSVAQLEKVVKKNDFENMADLVEKTKGKPTLAPITDKRPDFTQGTTAEQDFRTIKENA